MSEHSADRPARRPDPARMDRAELEAEVRRLRREARAAERAQGQVELDSNVLELEGRLRRLTELQDLAPVGLLTLDRHGIVRAANLAATEMLGLAHGSVVGFPLLPKVAPADRRRYLDHLRILRTGEVGVTVELALVRKGELTFDAQLVSAAVGGNGRLVTGYSVAIVDLTERRLAERALQRERGLLASVMAATDVMLVFLDPEFNFVWVNEAYAQSCGFHAKDMVGKNHFDLYPNRENEAIFRRVRDTGEPAFFKDKPFEFPDQPERGVTYWDWSLTAVKDADGRVTGLVFSLRDTTPFKRAEQDLFEVNQRLQAVLKAVPVGVSFSDDATCRRITGNPAVAAQFAAGEGDNISASALDPGSLGRRIRYFRGGGEVRSDELPLQRAVTEDHEVEPMELEVELPSGRRWSALASGAPIHDEAGRVVGGVAVTVDITAQKETQRELGAALNHARRQEVERAALLHAARTVLERPAFEEAAKTILASCKAVVGGKAGFVAMCTADGSKCRLVQTDTGDQRSTLPDDGLMPMRGLRDWVRTSRQTFFENAFAGSRWAGPVPKGHISLESVMLAPLVVGGDVLGFLGLANKPGGFTTDDVRLANAFAEIAGVALLNHRMLEVLAHNQELLEDQVRDRTARLEETNTTLDSERRRFYALLEELPLFVYLRAPDFTVRFANRYFREHFGQPTGKRCFELLGAGKSPCSGCRAADVLKNHIGASWEWASPDGRTYQIHNYPFEDADGTELVLEMGIDVTELRQAIRSEQRARQAADTLRASSLALTRTLELDAVLAALLEHLRGMVPYDRARVMVLEGGSRLVVRAAVDPDVTHDISPLEREAFDSEDNPVIHQVIASGTATVIADLHAHPELGEKMQPGFARSWMGVPLLARGRVVGMFSLSKFEAGFYSEDHVFLAEALSAQASVAVENALLFEEVREARERLQTLSRRLVQLQEAERRTIAMELHDDTGQSLTSLLYGLRLLEREAGDRTELAARAEELTRTAEGVLENLQRLAANLRPASLDHLGLEAAFRQLLAGIEGTTDLEVRFKSRGLEDVRLPGAVEIALYRVVQEALANVVKHAQATAVDVLVERREGRLVVMVEDNGVGFEPEGTVRPDHLGLIGMRERAETLGGTFALESAPSSGTTVVVDVPLPDEQPTDN